ncbi:MAG: signal peptidase II [Clostridia bacterium]|nr:signal peptidase II [Clostridia bacterium]
MLQLAIVLITAALVGLDQLTKWLATTFLQSGGQVVVWDGVFSFRYTVNTGAAWSMFDGQSWLLIGVTSVMVIGLMVVLLSGRFRKHKMANVGAVLVVAGGIGNLIDRLCYGYVVDFIKFDFMDFPIFNVADIFVVLGAVTLFVYFVFIYSDKSDSKIGSKNQAEEEEMPSGNNDDQTDVGNDGDEA